MRKQTTYLICGLLLLLAACETIDCTLYNTIGLKARFYSQGAAVSITDTLTISACGTDSVLLNRAVSASDVTLPMSFWQAADTFLLRVEGDDYVLADTLCVQKTNTPHFESPDCPSTMFHQITAVSCSRTFIDSVVIVQSSVNFSQFENIQIHLRSGD